MKITAEHYQKLKTGISEKHADMLANHTSDYEKYLAAGHTDKRIGWDLLHAAGLTPFVCAELYKYLNDTHIDTAVLSIMTTIKR